jgi:hypothetical protein
MPQGAARKRHTAVAIIGGRAHPQVLDAQAAQQPLRHPKRHASLGHMHSPIRLVLKQTLKLGHEVLVPACSCATFARRASGQAFHEGVDQLLLKPARGLDVDEYLRSNSGHPGGDRMEAAQMPASRRQGPPTLCDGWNAEWGSGQRAGIFNQFFNWYQESTPTALAVGSRVYLLPRAEGHYFTEPHRKSAVD